MCALKTTIKTAAQDRPRPHAWHYRESPLDRALAPPMKGPLLGKTCGCWSAKSAVCLHCLWLRERCLFVCLFGWLVGYLFVLGGFVFDKHTKDSWHCDWWIEMYKYRLDIVNHGKTVSILNHSLSTQVDAGTEFPWCLYFAKHSWLCVCFFAAEAEGGSYGCSPLHRIYWL